MSKYKSQKVTYNNLQFDSKFECTYYAYLQELEKKGEITNLQRQIKYELLPRQTNSKGKFLYHPIYYVSDFEYDVQGVHKTVDTKGMPTPDFRLKQKLFYYKFNRQIECVKYSEVKKNDLFKQIDRMMKNYFKCNGL